MQANLFHFDDYRAYLKAALSPPSSPRGTRKRLAETLGCQTSFLSQVLTFRTHLSLEHSLGVSDFLRHSPQETKYFLLLVQKGKAGTQDLESFFMEQITELQGQQNEIPTQIQVKDKLSPEDQALYYSAWYYAAIHISTALPHIARPEDIVVFLRLPLPLVEKTLKFLQECGLVSVSSGKLTIGRQRIHISKASPFLQSHHRNWRQKAMETLDRFDTNNIHYSGVIGISKKNRKKIEALLLQVIKDSEPYIKGKDGETDEEMRALLIDFFEL